LNAGFSLKADNAITAPLVAQIHTYRKKRCGSGEAHRNALVLRSPVPHLDPASAAALQAALPLLLLHLAEPGHAPLPFLMILSSCFENSYSYSKVDLLIPDCTIECV
jgi:hypothetical protein